MDFENNNTNQQEIVDNAEEVTEETQYTGCDEELSQELTDEEYEQMLEELPVEEPAKKKGFADFIAGLKNQAVCKLLFLFAAIGFIFPFFTVSCEGEVYNAYSTTGVDTFKGMSYLVGDYGEAILSKQWILIAAFAIVVIGLILTVFLKDEIKNIAGLVCSLASAACIGVFCYMLPTIVSDTMNTFLTKLSKDISAMYGTAIDLTDSATLAQSGLDLSGLKAVPQPGMYFVLALLIINAIYFITQLSANSKKKAAAEMTLTEGEFPEDFDESVYDEDAADEIEAALEEAAQATEDVVEEVTEETAEEVTEETIEE